MLVSFLQEYGHPAGLYLKAKLLIMGDGDETCPSSRLESGMLTREVFQSSIFSDSSRDIFVSFNKQINLIMSFSYWFKPNKMPFIRHEEMFFCFLFYYIFSYFHSYFH